MSKKSQGQVKKKKKRPLFPNGYNKKKKAPAIKITGKQQVINVITNYKNRLAQAIQYNKENMSEDVLNKKHKKDLLKQQNKKLKQLEQAIHDIEKSNIKPNAKTIEMYKQYFKEPSFKMEAEYAQEGMVYDKETNFRNMVLEQLRQEGVDIYNPSELKKVLGDNQIEDLLEYIETDEGENFYDKLRDEGAVDTIKELIHEKNLFENQLRRQYNLSSDWEIV